MLQGTFTKKHGMTGVPAPAYFARLSSYPQRIRRGLLVSLMAWEGLSEEMADAGIADISQLLTVLVRSAPREGIVEELIQAILQRLPAPARLSSLFSALPPPAGIADGATRRILRR